MPSNFVHLHCHTHYSLLDGAGTIPGLLQRAKDLEMPALAITDHGNLHGAVEFFEKAKKFGVKPVLGLEAYIAFGDLHHKKSSSQREDCYHLTLLAMNQTGFQNLVKMASVAALEGFYRRPRIDKELLTAHNEGIICLSGCASSEISRILSEQNSDSLERAKEAAMWYKNLFGDRYYIELQDNFLEIQKPILEGDIKVSKELNIPTVATNDVHYVYAKDYKAQEILLCINLGKTLADKDRMEFDSNEFFMRSEREMIAAMPGQDDAIHRTLEIVDRCNVDLDLGKRYFPSFTPPDNLPSIDYLNKLTFDGLKRRYANNPKRCVNGELSPEVIERAERELGVIGQLGFENYFLVVGDFVREAEDRGIHRTARGSGVGSIVCYALNMSHVCPLEYDLLFERFLDPSRPQAPDIDIDFDDDRRDEIFDYVKNKYGESNVARLITFQTMAAKGAVKDTGRVLGLPIAEVNNITKLVGNADTIQDALKGEELSNLYETDTRIQELLDKAQSVEGLVRGTGVHACGVVISDKPITEYAPLQYAKMKEGDEGKNTESFLVTQWEGHPVEEVGLLKMDFLGLKNLGALANAIRIIKETTGEEIDVYNLPIDDPDVFTLFQKGETKGIFQFESGGMREWLIRLKPDNFRDLIAMNALYRPGPMDNIPQYIAVKHGKQKAVYDHPILKDVLSETYGVIIYQEQIMRLFNRLGNIPLGESYDVIKAISKKNEEKIAKYRQRFIGGTFANGLSKEKSEELFENIAKFAGYGFNKSHATAYANVAYITAYLKVHYPEQFMAALLCLDTSKRNFTGKDPLVEHIEDCERMGLEIIPPDVNSSKAYFSAIDGKISFGLTAIARCGEDAMGKLVAEREANGKFTSLFNFCERVDSRTVNKAAIESLVKAGAFDSIHKNRAELYAQIAGAVKVGQNAAADAAKGQQGLFGDDAPEPVAEKRDTNVLRSSSCPDWSDKEKGEYEKEVLGFFMTANPLKEYEPAFSMLRSCGCGDAKALASDTQITLAGQVGSLVEKQYKKLRPGKPNTWAGFDFEDSTGMIRSIAWAEQYESFREQMRPGSVVVMRGKIDKKDESGDANFIVDEVYAVADAPAKLIAGVKITLDEKRHTAETVNQLATALAASKPAAGQVLPLAVELSVKLQTGGTAIMHGAKTFTRVTPDLKKTVTDLLGSDSMTVSMKPFKQREQRGTWRK
ncbi:DNA-directed DNA polymerase [Planctomycetales bacterium]|nr:DNA-directed DNA polymerase [Planctomycetales bacterium]